MASVLPGAADVSILVTPGKRKKPFYPADREADRVAQLAVIDSLLELDGWGLPRALSASQVERSPVDMSLGIAFLFLDRLFLFPPPKNLAGGGARRGRGRGLPSSLRTGGPREATSRPHRAR